MKIKRNIKSRGMTLLGSDMMKLNKLYYLWILFKRTNH
jgi:hypothetical protein